MSKKHMGSSIDDFLKGEDIFEEAHAQAVKEVVAWQLVQAMPGHERREDLQGDNGYTAQNEPHAG
ncbi:MAG TPA: hypothetical protein VK493_02825 [Bryobacteraceae bacterium]|nr:hypothetical protein [Bryobacteraceae bacterium]